MNQNKKFFKKIKIYKKGNVLLKKKRNIYNNIIKN